MDELLSHTGDSPLPLRVGGHVDQGQENVLRLVVKNLAECWWWVGRLHFEPGFTGTVVGNIIIHTQKCVQQWYPRR